MDAGSALVGTESFTLNSNRGITLTGGNVYLAVAAGKTMAYNGVITDGAGTYGFVKNQSGELVLGGANTYDGGSYLDLGTLTVSNASALGTAKLDLGKGSGATTNAATLKLVLAGLSLATPVTIPTNSTGLKTIQAVESATLSGAITNYDTGNDRVILDVASGKTLTLSGIISGSGGGEFTKTGAGTLLMSNTGNSHNKKITIDAGVLSIAASRNLGEDPTGSYTSKLTLNGGTLKATASFALNTNYNTVISGGAIDVDAGMVLTNGAPMSGSGMLAKLGNGVLKLTGASTFTGPLTNSAGVVQIGDNGTLGSMTANIVNNAALTFYRSDASTYAGILSGSGTLTNLAGTLTLSGHSTLNGATMISGGRVILSGSLSNSAVTVASGATLSGSGKVGNLTVTGTVDPTNAAAASTNLPCGTLTLNNGGAMRVDLSAASGTAGVNWDLVSGSGAITFSSGTFTINVYGAATGFDTTAGYSWKIMGGGAAASIGGTFTVATNGTFGAAGDGGTFSVTNSSTDVYLVFTPRTPVDPAAFTVTAVGADSNSISFTRNAQLDDVVIVYDLDNTFSTPTGTAPAVGGAFAGGNVVYKGPSSPAVHSGLNCGTLYYYKAWSMKGTNYSSPGTNGNATTQLASAPASVWASATNENDFTASWSAASGATSYRLDVSTVNTFASYVAGYQDRTVAGTSQSVTGLAYSTPYYFRVRTVSTGCTSLNSTTANVTTAIGTAYVALSDNGTQIAAANVMQGQTNQVLHRFKLAVTNANGTLTNVNFFTAGTYTGTDITNLIVWYSADATWDGADTRLFTNTASLGAGWHGNSAALSQVFNNNATGYVFITADISPTATLGANLQVTPAIATTNVLFAKATKTGSTTAGGLQTIIASEPTTQASALAFTGVQVDQMTIGWTSGNGANRIVVVKQGSAVDWTPADLTAPTGVDTNFSSATDQGSGNKICYNGSGTNFTLTGLSSCTNYYVKVFEYNGTGSYVNYLTSGTPLNGNQLTATPAAPTSLYANPTNATDFTANWTASSGAASYRLDVSTNASFGGAGGAGTNCQHAGTLGGGTGGTWTETSLAQGSASGNDYIQMLTSSSLLGTPTMDFTTASAQTLNFKARTFGGPSSAQATITVSVSTNNGSSWTSLGTREPTTTTLTSMTPFDLSSYAFSQVKVKLETLGAGSSKGVGVDDIIITNLASSASFVPGYSNRTVSGTSQLVTGLTFSTTYHYRLRAVGAGGCESENSSTQNVTTVAGTPYIALTNNGTQVAAGNIAAGSTNNVLHKFQLYVTNANATLTGVSFTTAGTYADTDVSNFKVYYSANSTLEPGTDTLLGTISSSLGTGAHSLSSLNQSISSGTTGFVFVAVDVSSTALAGNTINVSAVTTNDLTFAAGDESGTTAAGGAQTITAALAIDNTGAPVAGNVAAGASDVVLSGFRLSITGTVSFTALTQTTPGTATSSD